MSVTGQPHPRRALASMAVATRTGRTVLVAEEGLVVTDPDPDGPGVTSVVLNEEQKRALRNRLSDPRAALPDPSEAPAGRVFLVRDIHGDTWVGTRHPLPITPDPLQTPWILLNLGAGYVRSCKRSPGDITLVAEYRRSVFTPAPVEERDKRDIPWDQPWVALSTDPTGERERPLALVLRGRAEPSPWLHVDLRTGRINGAGDDEVALLAPLELL